MIQFLKTLFQEAEAEKAAFERYAEQRKKEEEEERRREEEAELEASVFGPKGTLLHPDSWQIENLNI